MKLRVGKTQVEFNVLMLAAAELIGYLWYTGKLRIPELAPTPSEGSTNNPWNQAPSVPDKGSLPQQDFSQYCTEPKPGEGWVCLPTSLRSSFPYPTFLPEKTEWKWYPPGTTLSDIAVSL